MFDIEKEITAYLAYCKFQKRLNVKTLKAYSIDLMQFKQHISITESSISKPVITKYIAHLHRKYRPKSTKRKLASIKAFFNFLEYEEVITNNPFKKIKTQFQEPTTLPRTIPLKTINTIIEAAYKKLTHAKTVNSTNTAWRNIAVIEMLFATGMRVSEICTLRSSNVNLDDGIINIMGKGSKERMLQIGNLEVLSVLRKYKEACLPVICETGFFFVNRLNLRLSEQSVRTMILTLCGEAGIALHITPHMFRHSFATLLLEEDVDIRYIQRMLGHSSIQTTQLYTQVTTEKQRSILTMKHPRNKISFKISQK